MSTDTDAKLIARVDAWVAAQCESWTGDRRIVAEEWRHKSRTTRTDGPDAGDRAAMGVILLALVRAAWGPTCSVVHVLDGGGWALITSGGALGLPELGKGFPTRFHRTYADGLVAALEAAP